MCESPVCFPQHTFCILMSFWELQQCTSTNKDTVNNLFVLWDVKTMKWKANIMSFQTFVYKSRVRYFCYTISLSDINEVTLRTNPWGSKEKRIRCSHIVINFHHYTSAFDAFDLVHRESANVHSIRKFIIVYYCCLFSTQSYMDKPSQWLH